MTTVNAPLIPRKSESECTEVRVPQLSADFTIPVVYQDDEILIVDKPYDVRVDGDFTVTVEKLVRAGLSIQMDKFRLCNQLDFSTSGLLVLGLSKIGARNCNKLFTERKSHKWYIAVGKGTLNESHTLLEPIRVTEPIYEVPNDFRMRIDTELGLAAETILLPIRTGFTIFGETATLFLVKLVTGRRHQIRLHLRHIGYPIIGDATYGDRGDLADRMLLHAWKLILPYPRNGRIVQARTCIMAELISATGWDAAALDAELDRLSVDM